MTSSGQPQVIAGIEALLAPYSVAEFRAACYGRRSVVLRAQRSSVRSLFSWTALQDIWRERGTVPLYYQNGRAGDARLDVPADHASLMIRMGATAVIDRLELLSSSVAGFADELAACMGHGEGRGARCYAGEAAHGFTMHFDAYHVFAVQMSGTKRWWVAPEPVEDPPDARAPVSAAPGASAVRCDGRIFRIPTELEPVDVEPGDVVYLPPFTWHRAVPTSRSLTVSFDLSDRPPRRDAGSVHMSWLGSPPEPLTAPDPG